VELQEENFGINSRNSISPKRIQAVYGSFANTNMRNTLDHMGNFERKQRPETAKINTKTM